MNIRTNRKFLLLGLAIGSVFPLAAWIIDIYLLKLPWTLESIIQLHRLTKVQFIIDLAPLVLGIVFYQMGCAYEKVEKKYLFRSLLTEGSSRTSNKTSLSVVSLVFVLLSFAMLAMSNYLIDQFTAQEKLYRQTSMETILKLSESDLFHAVELEKLKISDLVSSIKSGEIVAKLLTLQDSMEALIDSKEHTVLQKRLDIHDSQKVYQQYSIIDLDGQILTSNIKEEIGKQSHVFTSHQNFFSDIKAGISIVGTPEHALASEKQGDDRFRSGEVVIHFVIPIQDNFGRTTSAFIIDIDTHHLFLFLSEKGQFDQTGETYAFIEEGEIISEPRNLARALLREGQIFKKSSSTFATGMHLEVRDPGVNLLEEDNVVIDSSLKPFTYMAMSALQKENGYNLEGYSNYLGVEVIGSWLWSERLNIGIASEIEKAEAYKVLDFTVRTIWFMTFLLIVITLGLFCSLIKYKATRLQFLESIQESEFASRIMLESTSTCMFGIDTQYRCTFANSSFIDLIGADLESDVLGNDLNFLLDDKETENSVIASSTLYKSIEKTLTTSEVVVNNDILQRLNGKQFEAGYKISPIINNGYVIGAVVSVSDITEQVAAKKEKEERYSLLSRMKDAKTKLLENFEKGHNKSQLIDIEHKIVTLVAKILGIERVKIGYWNSNKTEYIVNVLYVKSKDELEKNTIYKTRDFPNYFSMLKNIENNDILVSEDVSNDLRFKDLYSPYLKPLNVISLMITPIAVQNKITGFITCEHSGERRVWTQLELDFLTSMSMNLSIANETNTRIISETRLKTILSTMIDGLITINGMGIVESFNPAAESIFGYPEKEVIGQNIKMLMPPRYSDNHDQYLKNYRDTGVINVLGKPSREVEGRRKDGTDFPLAISISEMHIDGIPKYSGVIRDITEVKKAEAEAKKITAEWIQFIDMANMPIFGIDRCGFIDEWNQKLVSLTGYEKVEALGKDMVAEFIIDEYKVPLKGIFDNALNGHEVANYEFHLFTKNGRRVDVLLNATTRRDMNGNIVGVMGVGQDITELRLKEKALSQAQKMEAVGQLTGGLAHDFNNLLSIIDGNLRNLSEELTGSDKDTQELLEDAMSAAHDGAELTQRLLSFSRTNVLKPKVIDVNMVIEKFIRFASRTLGSSINLTIDASSQRELYINADTSQLENALLNLAINARDAMSEGGNITIKVSTFHYSEVSPLIDVNGCHISILENSLGEGNYVKISVTDTGTGISASDIAHIYEPFFTTKDIGKGSGLGLSMVQGFAKQSKGDCIIQSKPGQGTTVSMYFPQVEAPDNNEEISGQPRQQLISKSIGSKTEVILLVEDEPRVRRVALRNLKKLGYKTIEAESAEVAKKILDSGEKIDLLFSDILMPGEMNGYMLAEWTNKNHPHIKIMLASGFSKPNENKSDIKRQWRLLKKPYSIEELTNQIGQILAAG